MTLGQNIARLRAQKNLSQGDLADALEVSRQSVSKWETDASIPELDKLLRLAELFGATARCRPPSPSAARTDRWSCLKTRAWDLRTRAMWIWHASAYGRCRTSWNRKTPCFYG